MRIHVSFVLLIFPANLIVSNAETNITDTLRDTIIHAIDISQANAIDWERNPILFESGRKVNFFSSLIGDYIVEYPSFQLCQEHAMCRIDNIRFHFDFFDRVQLQIPYKAWRFICMGNFTISFTKNSTNTTAFYEVAYAFPAFRIELTPKIKPDLLVDRIEAEFVYLQKVVDLKTNKIADSLKQTVMNETLGQITPFVNSLTQPAITHTMKNFKTLSPLFHLAFLSNSSINRKYYYHIVNTWQEPINGSDTLIIGPIKLKGTLKQVHYNYTYDLFRRSAANFSIINMSGESTYKFKSIDGSLAKPFPLKFIIDRLSIEGITKKAEIVQEMSPLFQSGLYKNSTIFNTGIVMRFGSLHILQNLNETIEEVLKSALQRIVLTSVENFFATIYV